MRGSITVAEFTNKVTLKLMVPFMNMAQGVCKRIEEKETWIRMMGMDV